MKTVDIVIPVYNEEHDLARSVTTLRSFLQEETLPYDWSIVIADNGSTDHTLSIAQGLAHQFPEVRNIHLDQKGRGRSLRKAWMESTADVVCYMDVDLSTGLEALPKMLEALTTEGYDVAIGSRLMSKSRTTRSVKREVISRCYNLMVKALFFTKFSDAQCGFKGLTRRAVEELVPLIEDQAWFFDSELLILAETRGFRLKEIPVEWVEDPDTRVKIAKTAWEDIKGLLRVRFHPVAGPSAKRD